MKRHWTLKDVLYWWRLGLDTQDIAKILNRGSRVRRSKKASARGETFQDAVTEAEIYNRLSWARSIGKLGKAA